MGSAIARRRRCGALRPGSHLVWYGFGAIPPAGRNTRSRTARESAPRK